MGRLDLPAGDLPPIEQSMAVDEIIVAAVLVAMMAALMSKRVTPAVGVIVALLVLYLTRVIDASAAFAGFSNPAPLTIAALYVVAAGVERSGALLPALRVVLGVKTVSAVLVRVSGSVAFLSALVANTPVVAMMISPVRAWAEGQRVAPSKVLLPLSYAAIIGGNLTLVGTSTNLVASGMLSGAGYESMSFWEPARLGLPFTVAALALVVIGGPRLMPTRGVDIAEDQHGDRPVNPYVVSLTVDPDGPLDGVSVGEGGLRALPSTYLVGVDRRGETLAPVAPEYVLRGGDTLTFAGQIKQVTDIDRMQGLTLDEHEHVWSLDEDQHAWFEVIIGAASPLVGRTIKQLGFRQRYQAAVVALNRDGHAIESKLGEARLQVGDSLLVVADLGFGDRWRKRGDFLFIHQRSEAPPTAQARAPLALAILAAVVLMPISGFADVLYSSVVGALAMVLGGVLTTRQARESVGLNVIVMIGAAIGIGASVQQTGLADRIAGMLSGAVADLGPWVAAVGLVATTLVLTELISNAGAVAVMLPIALSTAVETGGDPRQFALGVTLAAASSFLTPIGYQTNTMVFGPGRYHPADYLRLGLPLTGLVLLIAPLFMAYGW